MIYFNWKILSLLKYLSYILTAAQLGQVWLGLNLKFQTNFQVLKLKEDVALKILTVVNIQHRRDFPTTKLDFVRFTT